MAPPRNFFPKGFIPVYSEKVPSKPPTYNNQDSTIVRIRTYNQPNELSFPIKKIKEFEESFLSGVYACSTLDTILDSLLDIAKQAPEDKRTDIPVLATAAIEHIRAFTRIFGSALLNNTLARRDHLLQQSIISDPQQSASLCSQFPLSDSLLGVAASLTSEEQGRRSREDLIHKASTSRNSGLFYN